MTRSSSLEPNTYPRVLRELGAVERLFHLVSKRTNTHFCLVGEITGRLDAREVRAAFESVRVRQRGRMLLRSNKRRTCCESGHPVTLAHGQDSRAPTAERRQHRSRPAA